MLTGDEVSLHSFPKQHASFIFYIEDSVYGILSNSCVIAKVTRDTCSIKVFRHYDKVMQQGMWWLPSFPRGIRLVSAPDIDRPGMS